MTNTTAEYLHAYGQCSLLPWDVMPFDEPITKVRTFQVIDNRGHVVCSSEDYWTALGIVIAVNHHDDLLDRCRYLNDELTDEIAVRREGIAARKRAEEG